MLEISLNMYHAVALGAFLFWLGGVITSKISLLNRYCIPAPLVGGLCFSIVNCILYSTGAASITFDDTLQSVFMIMFFTTVGVTVSIPAGIDDGQAVSLRGQGNAGKNGGPAGDLLVTVTAQPHDVFRRDGTAVFCEAPITFTQAVLGAELEIPTIDGKVKYTIPEGTQTGTVFRLKGKGIPVLNGRGRGDQYVTVTIETPRPLHREQTDALRKFSETLSEGNYEKHRSFFKKK